MSISRTTKTILSLLALVAFGFIYLPLIVILINSFSTNRSLTWPPSGFTSEWWGRAVDSEGVRDALLTSVLVASAATAVQGLSGPAPVASTAASEHELLSMDDEAHPMMQAVMSAMGGGGAASGSRRTRRVNATSEIARATYEASAELFAILDNLSL